MISKLANFLESKDWNTVLNTAPGNSHSQFCDEEVLPSHPPIKALSETMDTH